MKHVLKAVNSELKSVYDDLKWHKREYKIYRDMSFKQKREIEELEINLKAANAIIDELREQLNNK